MNKEFLDYRIHTLINDGEMINKLNQNADSYYINSELVDLETPNLLKSSRSVQRPPLAPTDSISNSNDNTSVGCKQTSPITRGHINPRHLYIKFF